MAKSNVVIVGGGGYGISMACALSAKLDASKHTLTLISQRDYHFHLVAGLRMIVSSDGDLEHNALVPFDKLFDAGRLGSFKQGKVVAVHSENEGRNGRVELSDGTTVPWDVLLLAPGNQWEGGIAFPDTLTEALEFVKKWRETFAAAKSVALVGGGAVGIELAGELRDVYPNQKITLIHSSNLLLRDVYPDKWRKDMVQRLRAKNVELILGDSVHDIPEGLGNKTITTVNGRTVNADLIVPTRGGRPATSFLSPSSSPSLPPNSLAETGHIRITSTLQLESLPSSHILAIGDAVNSKEQKQLGKVGAYVDVVVSNILSLLGNSKGGKLKKYGGTFEAIAVTIGKNGGGMFVDKFWGITLGNWVVSNVKGKTLFVKPTRATLGY